MSEELNSFLADLPRSVDWQNIPDFNRLDERVAAVKVVLADTVGIETNRLLWVPSEFPPSLAEKLAWAWVVRPDLGEAIVSRASQDLRDAILRYCQG